MSRDPSLLPEDLRKQEEELQSKRAGKGNGNSRGALHVPGKDAVQTQQPSAISHPSLDTTHQSSATSTPSPPVAPRVMNGKRANGNGKKQSVAAFPVQGAPLMRNAPPLRAASAPVAPARARAPAMHVPDEQAPEVRSGGFLLPNLRIAKLHKRMLTSVSLIPAELRKGPVSPFWPQLIAAVGIAVVIPLVGIPWWMLTARVATARVQTEGVEATMSDLLGAIAAEERAVERYRVTADRAAVLQQLLETHGTWEAFFALIEAYSLPTVQYERVSVDTSGAVSLPTIAPDLRTAAMQLASWATAAHVRSSATSGFSVALDQLGTTRGTRFDLQLTVDPALFTMDPAAVTRPNVPPEAPAQPAGAPPAVPES